MDSVGSSRKSGSSLIRAKKGGKHHHASLSAHVLSDRANKSVVSSKHFGVRGAVFIRDDAFSHLCGDANATSVANTVIVTDTSGC